MSDLTKEQKSNIGLAIEEIKKSNPSLAAVLYDRKNGLDIGRVDGMSKRDFLTALAAVDFDGVKAKEGGRKKIRTQDKIVMASILKDKSDALGFTKLSAVYAADIAELQAELGD